MWSFLALSLAALLSAGGLARIGRDRRVDLETARLMQLLPDRPPLPTSDPVHGLWSWPDLPPSREKMAREALKLPASERLDLVVDLDHSPTARAASFLSMLGRFAPRHFGSSLVAITDSRLILRAVWLGVSVGSNAIPLSEIRGIDLEGAGPGGQSLWINRTLELRFGDGEPGTTQRSILFDFLRPLACLNELGVFHMPEDFQAILRISKGENAPEDLARVDRFLDFEKSVDRLIYQNLVPWSERGPDGKRIRYESRDGGALRPTFDTERLLHPTLLTGWIIHFSRRLGTDAFIRILNYAWSQGKADTAWNRWNDPETVILTRFAARFQRRLTWEEPKRPGSDDDREPKHFAGSRDFYNDPPPWA